MRLLIVCCMFAKWNCWSCSVDFCIIWTWTSLLPLLMIITSTNKDHKTDRYITHSLAHCKNVKRYYRSFNRIFCLMGPKLSFVVINNLIMLEWNVTDWLHATFVTKWYIPPTPQLYMHVLPSCINPTTALRIHGSFYWNNYKYNTSTYSQAAVPVG